MIYSPYPYIVLYVNETQIAKNSTSALNSKNQTQTASNMMSKISKKIAQFPHPIVNIERYQLSRFVVQLENNTFYGFNAIYESIDFQTSMFSPSLSDKNIFEDEIGWYENERKWKIRSSYDLPEDYSWLRLTNGGCSVKIWSKFGAAESRKYSSLETQFREAGDLHLDSVIEIAVSKDNHSVFALIRGKKGVLPSSSRLNTKKSSKRTDRSNNLSRENLTGRSRKSGVTGSSTDRLKNRSKLNIIRYYLNYSTLGYGQDKCHSFELNSIAGSRKYSPTKSINFLIFQLRKQHAWTSHWTLQSKLSEL